MLVTLTRKQPEKRFCRSDLCSDCSSAEVMSSATIKYQPSNPLCNHLYLPQFILTALIPQSIHVNTACYIVFVLKQWTILSVNKNKMLTKIQTVFIVTVKNSKSYICLYEIFVCMKQTRSSRWHPSLIHTDAPKNTSALAGSCYFSEDSAKCGPIQSQRCRDSFESSVCFVCLLTRQHGRCEKCSHLYLKVRERLTMSVIRCLCADDACNNVVIVDKRSWVRISACWWPLGRAWCSDTVVLLKD